MFFKEKEYIPCVDKEKYYKNIPYINHYSCELDITHHLCDVDNIHFLETEKAIYLISKICSGATRMLGTTEYYSETLSMSNSRFTMCIDFINSYSTDKPIYIIWCDDKRLKTQHFDFYIRPNYICDINKLPKVITDIEKALPVVKTRVLDLATKERADEYIAETIRKHTPED